MKMHPEPRLLFAGAWHAEAGQDADPHRQMGWKVTFYRTGRIDSIVNGRRLSVAAGDALVLPPRAVHEEIARTAYSNLWIVVDLPDDHPWPETIDARTAHDLGWLLDLIVREHPRIGEPENMIAPLLNVLDVTLRRARPRAPTESRAETAVRVAETILEGAYAGPVSIASVARQANTSPSSLREYFASRRGIAPHTALQRIRLRHALTLLRTSDFTLAAIAERCGFSSASHLSRHVKAATGTSPGRLRE